MLKNCENEKGNAYVRKKLKPGDFTTCFLLWKKNSFFYFFIQNGGYCRVFGHTRKKTAVFMQNISSLYLILWKLLKKEDI